MNTIISALYGLTKEFVFLMFSIRNNFYEDATHKTIQNHIVVEMLHGYALFVQTHTGCYISFYHHLPIQASKVQISF